ncbi:MAG TPA: flagellar hook-basal body complex protein FliE [Fimbriimonadaceae bacterium]|nr:flagellar hook-basal body complex protein FliE [Fimbriimonadaceae bacterium]
MRIGAVNNQEVLKGLQRAGQTDQSGDFAQQLTDVLKEVNDSQMEARSQQEAFMTNQPVDYHDLMIAMERASTSMQLTMAVRNKLLEAYQEITRMQV